MAAVPKEAAPPEPASPPVVIVGSGPVGVRVAQELARRRPDLPLVLYGAEACEPYNRVRLSSFLAGELALEALTGDLEIPAREGIQRRLGCAVVAIDRMAHAVTDAFGRPQPYGSLVLATGSTPYVPAIPGIERPEVTTFRDFDDAQRLFARRARSRRTVVLGGGLLGLEAARAMRRFNTEVVVVEQESRLMPQQLDEEGAAALRVHVERLGIRVVTGDGVRRLAGEARLEAVQLRSGTVIECDTVVVATGIRPSVELARRAGLSVGRGIRVDDAMRTSDPHIFAVGECAEHNEIVYGLVAPGLEQAAVAAARLAGEDARYSGSMSATRLKVLDLPVFSIGRVRDGHKLDLARVHVYRTKPGKYAKAVVERGRLIGAIRVGDFAEAGRLQEAVARARRVMPWQAWRFSRQGSLWPEANLGGVADWPDGVTVCSCTGVTRGALGRALASGCATPQALAAATGASTVCGSCRPLLAELAGVTLEKAPEKGGRPLAVAGVGSIVLLSVLVLLSVPYAPSVQVPWSWDVLWRESFWKQASGYAVLGLTVLALLLSLRKRIRKLALGEFAHWRVVHAVVAALTLAGLAVHTGGRLGANLNLVLMLAFLPVVALGAGAGGVVAMEHRLGSRGARLRRAWTWVHLLAFWPVPVLLGMHVLKSYYF